MYEPGLASINKGRCNNDDCEHSWDDEVSCDHERAVSDSRADFDQKTGRYAEPLAPCVTLPHSCDSWVIGGRAQVEQMIADLTSLLEEL